MRYAIVHSPIAVVESYLPGNYKALDITAESDDIATLIVGKDVSGWTLDGYVIPRLASGLHFAHELVER